jgi:hypothetical protein
MTVLLPTGALQEVELQRALEDPLVVCLIEWVYRDADQETGILVCTARDALAGVIRTHLALFDGPVWPWFPRSPRHFATMVEPDLRPTLRTAGIEFSAPHGRQTHGRLPWVFTVDPRLLLLGPSPALL